MQGTFVQTILRRRLAYAFATLVLFFSACDSNRSDDEGSFTATLVGDVNTTFGSDATAFHENSGYTIALGNGTNEAMSLINTNSSLTRPVVGSYKVLEGAMDSTQFLVDIFVSPTLQYGGVSGNVIITSSTATEIAGELSFLAETRNPRTKETVDVTGTFRAVVRAE